ncbi:trehalose-phosphatase [candidate division KSB1 bacterium]|nr:trehalose-phosphatase [candidate division KSB1 bacterium]
MILVKPPAQPVEGIPGFWDRVRRAPRRFLGLDYDGTLAPFKIERMKARPLPGTEQLVTTIARDASTRVAVLSGRPISELLKLLGPLEIEMAGAHGWELRRAGGGIVRRLPESPQSDGLEAAYLRAQDTTYRPKLERKVASLAFHSRGALEQSVGEETIKGLWLPIALEYGLELREFNGGIELRAPGFNKGTALLELLKTEPNDSFVVYIGDDDTDEDAFEALKGRGLGLRVGGYGLRTAAAGRLANCEAVQDFLRMWCPTTPAGR